MAKTREKKIVFTKPISREDAEASFAEYASADAKIQKVQAEIDIKITAIREKYQDVIAANQEVKDLQFDKIQAYADQNPDLFVKRKSMELTHGTIGFRTGTPKLKAMKGFTWASCLTMIKEFLPNYIRVEEAINKEALISDRENTEVNIQFGKCGIMIDRDETFYIEPKKEMATA
jgi:phage host-nuclease inhibitor protein Gam